VRQCGSVRAGLIFAWGDGDDATGDRPARKTAIGYRVAASSEPPSPRKSLLDNYIYVICPSKGAPFRLPKPFSDQFPAPEPA